MSGASLFDGVFDSLPVGLSVHDPETAEFLDANRRFCEMYGYARAEVCEMEIRDLTADGWAVPADPVGLIRRAREDPPVEVEWCSQDRAGERFWVEVVLTQIDAGVDGAVLATVRRIAKRKERERQLQVLDRVLRHNLYNDMNVVRSRAELIRERAGGELAGTAERIIEKVDEFIDTADKEREVVELVLESGEQARVDVTERVRGRVARVRKNRPVATIETDLPEEAHALVSAGFGRAVQELIENAVRHHDRPNPRVEVSVEREADSVAVHVADDGPGIPEQEVNVLTERSEIAPLYHGSGLGLWLVNWAARSAGGETGFSERDPRGSVVTIRQPAGYGNG